MKHITFKNLLFRYILPAIALTIFSFILLNITFVVDFLFQSLIRGIVMYFIPIDEMKDVWFPPLMHFLFVIFIGCISWIVFKSKLRVFIKATYMTVPLAVVMVTIGMFLYQWSVVSFLLGGLFILSVLYYLHYTKQPWLYYYSTILISLTFFIVGLLGVEI